MACSGLEQVDDPGRVNDGLPQVPNCAPPTARTSMEQRVPRIQLTHQRRRKCSVYIPTWYSTSKKPWLSRSTAVNRRLWTFP